MEAWAKTELRRALNSNARAIVPAHAVMRHGAPAQDREHLFGGGCGQRPAAAAQRAREAFQAPGQGQSFAALSQKPGLDGVPVQDGAGRLDPTHRVLPLCVRALTVVGADTP